MREIVRVELPLSTNGGGAGSSKIRVGGTHHRIRPKLGNVAPPTPSIHHPTVSMITTSTESANNCSDMTTSGASSQNSVTPLSSFENDLAKSNNNESSCSVDTSSNVVVGLHLDIPPEAITEDAAEDASGGVVKETTVAVARSSTAGDADSVAAAYDSDDSLKDLNWLGGLNPAKISTNSSSSRSKQGRNKPMQSSPRRSHSTTNASSSNSNNNTAITTSTTAAFSPRNRVSHSGSLVVPYMKRVPQPSAQPVTPPVVATSPPPTTSAAGTALSPIRQSSPLQSDAIQPSPNRCSSPYTSSTTASTTSSVIHSAASVSSVISHPPWIAQQREVRRLNRLKRPPFSYVALCCMALANSETLTLPLTQLYKWIEDNFPYYARPECYQDWRSSIRHTLSLYTFFQSVPVLVGRKTIPTWRLDVTESERLELARLVVEYQKHLNSQFISEWTSRLVYAEQRSHRRGAYDRQASRFKAYSTLKSRSSSTDTLTSTHSNSTSATAQSGYQSFTPDSGMSSIASGSVHSTALITEADVNILAGTVASNAGNQQAAYHHPSATSTYRQMSPGPVMFCGNAPGCTITSSPAAPTAPANSTATCFETGPGITIIRIPPSAAKFGLLVIPPPTQQAQLNGSAAIAAPSQQQLAAPATPMSIVSDQSSSAPLFDLTNQSVQMQQQMGPPSVSMSGPPSVVSTPPGSVINHEQQHQQQQSFVPWEIQSQERQHMQFMAEYHSQLTSSSQVPVDGLISSSSVMSATFESSDTGYNNTTNNTSTTHEQSLSSTSINMSSNDDSKVTQPLSEDESAMVGDDLVNDSDVADFVASMELDLSLQDFECTADDLFSSDNIDFGAVLDGALDTPRSVLLPPYD